MEFQRSGHSKPRLNAKAFAMATVFPILLGVGGPARADVIELSSWWGGNTWDANIVFNGTNYHNGANTSLSGAGGAGGFKTYDLTKDPQKLNAFESWCVDIFHDFYFPASGSDTLKTAATVFGLAKANDLGRLATNHFASVASMTSTALNAAAFQLAIWEIVNEGAGNSYNLSSGNFKVTGTGASLAQTWLNELNAGPSASAYAVNIWTVQQGAAGWGPQDVAVFTSVPEPGTFGMLLASIGIIGLIRRRKRR